MTEDDRKTVLEAAERLDRLARIESVRLQSPAHGKLTADLAARLRDVAERMENQQATPLEEF